MTSLKQEVNKVLKHEFTKLITNLEQDYDVIEAMPLEDIEQALQHMGLNGNKCYAAIRKKLTHTALTNRKGQLLYWLSPVWEPQWAGQAVTAQDIPIQQYSFPLEDGAIDISCAWGDAFQSRPAFLTFSWKAHISEQRDFWLRLINPETQEIRYEDCVGNSLSGEETLTHNELGFNPAQETWALSIYTT
ncbi:hypothetical protein CSB45_02390 [candidate division KSB3 bacterium]|uniref:Uncharacterized protein n=1 Tax=candidate division KSB3 bacterium TaxID=2044937 RepID=A0A2G6EAT7_9BACT|nr:MAG: hypothetical protein CSB45_02390 [candidate division KSB3 bacterium]PIE30929.1 MAG: hypothetical protein CSA57_01000 [candidate division KSB3 bacterium]